MSHFAMRWANALQGLKPYAKLLLLQLADRQNSKTKRCDPSQERLAADVCISRSSVNRYLTELEQLGLIKRLVSVDPHTRLQKRTFYILGCDQDLSDHGSDGEAVSHSDTRINTKSVCQKTPNPCVKNDDIRVSDRHTNLGREPKKKPSCTSADARGIDQGNAADVDSDFEKFWLTHPRPRNRQRSRTAWDLLRKGGMASAAIIQQAEQYRIASRKVESQYRCSSDLWLEERRWERTAAQGAAKPAAKPQSAAEFWAGKISAGNAVPSSAISQGLAREMVGAGLVSSDRLRSVGVYL